MELEINNNPVNHHFEAIIAGKTAFVDYKLRQDALVVISYRSAQGMGRARHCGCSNQTRVGICRSRKPGVVPLCPYMRTYLGKHPEYQHLVRKLK